jgi:hypothetical protein
VADPLVLYQVDDKISIITRNRPDKLNAISHALHEALTDRFMRADVPATTSARRDLMPTIGGAMRQKAHAHLQQLVFEMMPWLMALEHLGFAIQRQEVAELTDQDMHQQRFGCHAAIDRRSGADACTTASPPARPPPRRRGGPPVFAPPSQAQAACDAMSA